MELLPRAKRSSVFIDAHLDIGEPFSAPQIIRIRDMSEGGARIQGKSPGVGARIVVIRGETEIAGRVVWTDKLHFGVAFDEPIDVAAVLKVAGPKAPGKPIYASALTSGLSHLQRRPGRDRPSSPLFGMRIAAAR